MIESNERKRKEGKFNQKQEGREKKRRTNDTTRLKKKKKEENQRGKKVGKEQIRCEEVQNNSEEEKGCC